MTEKKLSDLEKVVKLERFRETKVNALLVEICDKIQAKAKANNIHFASNEFGTYIYNDTCWEKIEKLELSHWLLKYALNMGAVELTVKQFQNLESLTKQFEVNTYQPRGLKAKGLINLSNGTLNVNTKVLQSHNPTDFFTYSLPFGFDPKATCPKFLKYLNEVLPDGEAQKVVQEYIGYVFLNLKLEKVALLYGSGANGKSVLLDIITALLGVENVSSYSLANLTREDGRYIAGIAPKLLNVCNDISGVIGDSGVFKTLVSCEPISARELYHEPFIVTEYAKLLFSTNELPVTTDFSNGFFRRLLLIPFMVEIPKERQDKELAKKIIESELSGILNWVLLGMDRLVESQKFSESETVNKQVAEYRNSSDNISLFVSDEGLVKSNEQKKPLKDVYLSYRSFCIGGNYKEVTRTKFADRMQKLGFNIYEGAARTKYINAAAS